MAVQAENKLQALPLDLQHCERVNPQTGLVECLTALVILHTLVSFCENFSCLLYVNPLETEGVLHVCTGLGCG